MDLPQLPEPLRCHMTLSCDGFQCCVKNEALGTDFYVTVTIDNCEHQLSGAIENLPFHIGFSELTFGKLLTIPYCYYRYL